MGEVFMIKDRDLSYKITNSSVDMPHTVDDALPNFYLNYDSALT